MEKAVKKRFEKLEAKLQDHRHLEGVVNGLKGESPDPESVCINIVGYHKKCGKPTMVGSNYCYHCWHIHGSQTKRKKYLHSDLPLKARVAKALGKKPFFDYVDWCSIEKARRENLGAWCYATDKHPTTLILDYPNDIKAAMEALKEYCERNDLCYRITWSRQGTWISLKHVVWGQSIKKSMGQGILYVEPLPEAISKAIAHAESSCPTK